MRDILWTAPAEEDLAAIDANWWQQAPDRADTILDAIEAAGNFLRGTPFAGPALEAETAGKWNVAGTRYILIYRVMNDRIEVLRVRHSSENWTLPH